MEIVEFARRRYDAALEEVGRLLQSDFPYPHSREALVELEKVFRDQLDDLNQLLPTTSAAVLKNACSQSLYSLFQYTPFLGFILRSTNTRNAFELYPPLLRLSRQVLGPDTKLLLSSEWDYSPFVFMPTPELPNFVLIGLPAQESSNPLLITLAGHELGHRIWKQQSLTSQYDARIMRVVVDTIKTLLWSEFQRLHPLIPQSDLETTIFARATWIPAVAWALRQLEEVYCDVMGACLFGEAYLYAFAYLVSPCTPGERALYYPNVPKRVSYLERAAAKLGVRVPNGFSDYFDAEDEPTDANTKLLVTAADAASEAQVDAIIDDVISFSTAKALPTRSDNEVSRIARDFKMVVPIGAPASLTDIINAGWVCYRDSTLWNNVPQIKSHSRNRVLNDLILKSCEISEVFTRAKAP